MIYAEEISMHPIDLLGGLANEQEERA